MPGRRFKYARPLLLGILSMACLTASAFPSAPEQAAERSGGAEAAASPGTAEPAVRTGDGLPSYREALRGWRDSGLADGTARADIPSSSFTAGISDEFTEFEFYAERDGLYALEAVYAPLDPGGDTGRLLFSVAVNDGMTFREAGSLTLDRYFKDKEELRYDKRGNQLRPSLESESGRKQGRFRDSDGAYAQPVLWHLQQGTNRVKIKAILASAEIDSLAFVPPEPEPPDYEEARRSYPAAGAGTGKGEPILIEAERFSAKNSSSVQTTFDRDPATTPTSFGKTRLNALGGISWNKGRQSVTWEFTAPRDDVYRIAIRFKQNFRENLSSFRTVSIDGRVPFREMEAWRFPYSGGWQSEALEDEAGVPYEFYLTEGRHTLTLESNYEPFVPVRLELEALAERLELVYERLREATGNRTDVFRVWRVEKELPGLTEELESLRGALERLETAMREINGERDNVSQTIRSVAADIGKILREPDEIPSHMPDFSAMQAKLEQQREDLAGSPLMVDKIAVVPSGAKIPKMKAGWLDKWKGQLSAVYHSFDESNRLDRGSEDALQVWMLWGRDHVNELQRLADERFTPQSGYEVQINLVPTPDLLISSSAAGILPDVALGVPSGVPFELALRGAALDLSALPGADRLLGGYAPGMLVPYFYQGGYYGIPETANLKVLFYRTDIMERLGLEPPDTWGEVYALLPTLLQNDYNFYVDPADASYMFFQKGADFYPENGLITALDEPKAYEAFKEWTELFNRYGLERQVLSFYNQFRKGSMPIGISDLNDYMRLLVAAPEIANRWAIAPVPGTAGPDGAVARWINSLGTNGSASTSAMMFKQSSPDKQEAAWAFVQWYLSEETQKQFGENLEQFYGEAFRWNSANVRAFAGMPWKADDLRVFLRQWSWTKEIPNVPGGYMTSRELGFAWNRAVIDLQPARVALDQAVKQINRELKRKQQEFRLSEEDGSPSPGLQLPRVAEPWKEAERLVPPE